MLPACDMPVTGDDGTIDAECLIAGVSIVQSDDSANVDCYVWKSAGPRSADINQAELTNASVSITLGGNTFPLEWTPDTIYPHHEQNLYQTKVPLQETQRATITVSWNGRMLNGSIDCISMSETSLFVRKIESSLYTGKDSVYELSFNLKTINDDERYYFLVTEYSNGHELPWSGAEFRIPDCRYFTKVENNGKTIVSLPVYGLYADSLLVHMSYINGSSAVYRAPYFTDPNMCPIGNLFGLEPVFSYHLFNMRGDGYGVTQYRSDLVSLIKIH